MLEGDSLPHLTGTSALFDFAVLVRVPGMPNYEGRAAIDLRRLCQPAAGSGVAPFIRKAPEDPGLLFDRSVSVAGGRRDSGVPRPVRLDCNRGRRRIGIAVAELLARRRAVGLSRVVRFGSNGRLRRQYNNYRSAEDAENGLTHGHLPLWVLQKIAGCAFRSPHVAMAGRSDNSRCLKQTILLEGIIRRLQDHAAKDAAAISQAAAFAFTGGTERKLIAIRFQALMVAISMVRLTVSTSENWARTAS
jgi:hypothetical protein